MEGKSRMCVSKAYTRGCCEQMKIGDIVDWIDQLLSPFVPNKGPIQFDPK